MDVRSERLPTPGSGAMFDRIAGRYDLLNRLMSLGLDSGWRRHTVALLSLPPSALVLDLATGTGDVALAVAKRHADARVVGVDPSAEMLRVARQKIETRGLDQRIELRSGNAHDLPFDEDTFDGATIAFGIRNVPDRALGLRELARVTKPSGRISILEAVEPSRGIWARGARLWVHHLIPRIGALLSGATEYRYLQSSIEAFPAPRDFESLMDASGIEPLETRGLGFGACALFVGRPRGGGS